MTVFSVVSIVLAIINMGIFVYGYIKTKNKGWLLLLFASVFVLIFRGVVQFLSAMSYFYTNLERVLSIAQGGTFVEIISSLFATLLEGVLNIIGFLMIIRGIRFDKD